ncbi:hypothetical protein A2U01_0085137, partial [Trifolium medium]|nr:hypothetical protein [Trifolium medium]
KIDCVIQALEAEVAEEGGGEDDAAGEDVQVEGPDENASI